jgi:hypothetical protein
MKKNAYGTLSKRFRQAAMAIVASSIAAGSTVEAYPSNNLVFVAPTDLPELARLPGDAMFLHEVRDGRTVLYVEQNQGAQLAIFDVTDPGHIKGQGSVQLGTAGPFDFVSSLGSQKEIVRFRQDQKVAILDVHAAAFPSLTRFTEPDSQGPISLLGENGFIVSGQGAASRGANDPQTLGDFKVFDAARLDLDRVFDVKQVRATVLKHDTGTTFLLTERGLFLIRQPSAESEKKRRDEEWFWQHNGN